EAIAQWRRRMLAAGIETPVPLDELESHLREDIEHELQSGRNAEEAFAAAVQRIGSPDALKREFVKVGETCQVLRRKLVWALIGLGAVSCAIQFSRSPAVALVYGILLAGLI